MKAFSVFVVAVSFSAGNLSAQEMLATTCPEIADIHYIEDLALYQAVLPGTRVELESQLGRKTGKVERFDSVFVDVYAGVLTYCVYRLADNNTMVLWPTQSTEAKSAIGPWAPFLEYQYCFGLSQCRFLVRDAGE